MPRDTPDAFFKECEISGAHLERVDGLISDCGKIVAERKDEAGEEFAKPIVDAQTDAFGLRVPGGVGDFLILRAVCESGGTAVAALQMLVDEGVIDKDERTVVFDTGSGAKYSGVYGGRKSGDKPPPTQTDRYSEF